MSYTFDVDNVEGWQNCLINHGYVVIRNVATKAELFECQSLYWDHFEERNKSIGLTRHNPHTWIQWNIGMIIPILLIIPII